MTRDDEYKLLNKSFDDLFPIFRSITGPGIEYSINYFKKFMPLELEKTSTGEKVFDWIVPQEWHCNRARLFDPNGNIVCDTFESNLHVLNYSEPVDKILELHDLEKHLYSLPGLPEAIPYVTSYYKRAWGFCISHKVREGLRPGKYRVLIESKFSNGGVPFATCLLKGESEREIMLTSYLCHPSLANNELSGPLVLLLLYLRLSSSKKRRYSYRFVLTAETIGTLCFLNKYQKTLDNRLESGMVITCIGGPNDRLRYKASRRGNTLFDNLAKRISLEKDQLTMKLDYEDFSPCGGSDERQYCSPGFNLPMGQMARTVYGQYDGYHNSLDNKESMSIDALIESADALEDFLSLAEVSGHPVNLYPYGEPQLGKRGLYPNINSEETRGNYSGDQNLDGRAQLEAIQIILNMADGSNNMDKIANCCGQTIRNLESVVKLLEEKKLIRFNI